MKEWKRGTKVDVINFNDSVLSIEPDSAKVVQVSENQDGDTEIIIDDSLIGSFLVTYKGTSLNKTYHYLRGSLSSDFRLYGIDLTEMIESLKLDVRVQDFAMKMSIDCKDDQLQKILGIKENLLSSKIVEEEPTTINEIKHIYHFNNIFYRLDCYEVSLVADSIIFAKDNLQLFITDNDIRSGNTISNSQVYYLGFTERNKLTLLNKCDNMFDMIFDEMSNCENKKNIYTLLLTQIESFENDVKKEVGRS